MNVVDLKTLDIVEPLGIDGSRELYFSWKLTSDEPDTLQECYRLKVTSLDDGDVMFDSGIVMSDETAFIPYGGKKLKSRTGYKVIVTVRDNHENESSAEAIFETAFMDRSDWKAMWVKSGLKRKKGKPGFGNQSPATMFRKGFILKEKPKKARLYATCHGIYRLTLNGIRTDEREFAPEHTVYGKYLCYQTYDATDFLKDGENAIGMYVGDGWYFCPQTAPDMKTDNRHAVIFQLEVEYVDGTFETIVSDEKVKTAYGPVICSDLFAGEMYDANFEVDRWDEAGFDDSLWKGAVVADYGVDNLVAQPEEPVICVKILEPEKILSSPRGELILDFGQNFAGRLRMHVHIPKGEKLLLEHCEILDESGNYTNNILGAGGVGKGCDQRDCYISSGDEAIWESMFTYHGFRYVKITGIANIDKNDFKAIVLSTNSDNVGTFETSDALLNRFYENTRWSQTSNMLSVPTDCPQREKAGWTGDMLVYSRTAMLNSDCTGIFTRWLLNMTCDQDEYGKIPMVVPQDGPYPKTGRLMNIMFHEKGKATSSGWGDAAVIVPYNMYMVTGNTSILRQQYDTMKKWCDHIIKQAVCRRKGSTLPDEFERYLWNTGYHYGEWLIPSQSKNGMDMKNLKNIMGASSCYTAPIFGWNSVNKLSEIAKILDRNDDARYYGQIADNMKKAIQKGVIKPDGSMPSELMGAYVLPIYFDLVPDELVKMFAEHLISIIEQNDFKLDTGFLATPFLMDALCKIGRQDIAYRILWQEKCPSWLFEVKHGATTVWESWYGYDENGRPGNLSFNHYSFGAVDDWLFRFVAGIDTDTPGYKHVIIKPQPDDRISSCKRIFESSCGKIFCEWKRIDNEFIMDVEIPCNATADICLPDGSCEKIGSGRYNFRVSI